MSQFTQRTLTMFEIWPVAHMTDYEVETLARSHFEMGSEKYKIEYLCAMTPFGNDPGPYNSGLDYVASESDIEYELKPDKPELCRIAAKAVSEAQASHVGKPSHWWLPVRVILAWEFTHTIYSATPDYPEEHDSQFHLLGVFDVAAALQEFGNDN